MATPIAPDAASGAEAQALHQALVDRLVRARTIRQPAIIAAWRAIPRHLFLPGTSLQQAYRDEVVIIKRGDGQILSSASQPTIMGLMQEQLALAPGMRVLEIGAGSGFNAALLAHVVGEAGRVVTIDIDPDSVAWACRQLEEIGYSGVDVRCADGRLGAADAAPFDRIILTAAAPDIAPAWWAQLRPNGRLVMPWTANNCQELTVTWQRQGDGLVSSNILASRFIPIRGDDIDGIPALCAFGEDRQTFLVAAGNEQPTPAAMNSLLAQPSRQGATAVRARVRTVLESLRNWLILTEPAACEIRRAGETSRGALPIPWLTATRAGYHVSFGLWQRGQLSLVTTGTNAMARLGSHIRAQPLQVRHFGKDSHLANQLNKSIVAWDEAGRPDLRHLEIRAYRAGMAPPLPAGATAIRRSFTTFHLNWRPAVRFS